MKKNGMLLLFCLSIFAGCKKDKGEAADSEPPVIKMSSPTAGQVFKAGQTATISGTITDNAKVEEVHVEIINTTAGTFLTHEHLVPDGPTYALSRPFTIPAAATYKIKIEADDAKGNKSEVEVSITAN